jgi:methylmalonyl-CoA/ethylmalonyl-CoA epimerase
MALPPHAPSAPAPLKGFRIDHIGVAVPDLARAARFYRDVLGCEVGDPVVPEGQGIGVVFVAFANTRVELIAPTCEVSPLPGLLENHTINDFLRRSPQGGLHHVCYEVDDLGAVIARLAAAGVRLLGTGRPIMGASGRPIAFLDPGAAEGTLIELKQGA